MPYTYVEPEIYLTHNGVEVFHGYSDGDDTPCDYWFTTNQEQADNFSGHGKNGWFDARIFAGLGVNVTVGAWDGWWRPRFKAEADAIRALVIGAIDQGRLPTPTEESCAP